MNDVHAVHALTNAALRYRARFACQLLCVEGCVPTFSSTGIGAQKPTEIELLPMLCFDMEMHYNRVYQERVKEQVFPAGNATGFWEGRLLVDLKGDVLCIAIPGVNSVQTWTRNANIPDDWGKHLSLSLTDMYCSYTAK